VHVARLAGVPAPVVKRAGALLAALEKGREPVIADLPLFAGLATEPPEENPVLAALAELNPDSLSARDALDLLYRLKSLT
jgi:DNA mismatch repair protein MutS